MLTGHTRSTTGSTSSAYWQDRSASALEELKDPRSRRNSAARLRTFKFEAKFGEPEAETIEFGHYKGQRKWPTVMHIPDQRIRDALLNLIVYQGDTEFASVEQQRALLRERAERLRPLSTSCG